MQQNSGSPCAKFVVPSIGSTIQQYRERVSPVGPPSLLGEDVVAGMPLGDERANHALDRQVHLGDQIDRALLVNLERAAQRGQLDRAGALDGVDGGGEVW